MIFFSLTLLSHCIRRCQCKHRNSKIIISTSTRKTYKHTSSAYTCTKIAQTNHLICNVIALEAKICSMAHHSAIIDDRISGSMENDNSINVRKCLCLPLETKREITAIFFF